MKKENYPFIARSVITYLLLGMLGSLTIIAAIFSGFGIYIAKVIGVAAISSCLAVIARRVKEKQKGEGYSWKKLASDIGFIFKITMIAMITMLQGGPGVCMVGALLVFEKSHLIPKDSMMGRFINQYPWLSIIIQLLLVAAANLSMITFSFIGTCIISYPSSAAIATLSQLFVWAPLLLSIIGFAKIHGKSFEDLWFINGRKKNEPYFSWKRDWLKIIAFLVTSASFFICFCFPEFVAVFFTFQMAEYILASIALYAIQPLVEELFYRSALIKYFQAEGVVDKKDITKTSIWSKLSVSAIGGVLFAIVHQSVRGFSTLAPYLRLFMMGAMSTYLTISIGSIGAAVIFHSLHNFFCKIFYDSFCTLGQLSIKGVHVNPIVAETVRAKISLVGEESYKTLQQAKASALASTATV